jgi:hypothetical protein
MFWRSDLCKEVVISSYSFEDLKFFYVDTDFHEIQRQICAGFLKNRPDGSKYQDFSLTREPNIAGKLTIYKFGLL